MRIDTEKKIKDLKNLYGLSYETVEDFINACDYGEDSLVSDSRIREIVDWRKVASLFYLEERGSTVVVGDMLGGKDHATILHYLKCLESSPQTYSKYFEKVKEKRRERLGIDLQSFEKFMREMLKEYGYNKDTKTVSADFAQALAIRWKLEP